MLLKDDEEDHESSHRSAVTHNVDHLRYAGEEPPVWLTDYVCCLCLELCILPVRVVHRGKADCGLVLCQPCHTSWVRESARAEAAPCPRCRDPCEADPDRAADAFLCRQLASLDAACRLCGIKHTMGTLLRHHRPCPTVVVSELRRTHPLRPDGRAPACCVDLLCPHPYRCGDLLHCGVPRRRCDRARCIVQHLLEPPAETLPPCVAEYLSEWWHGLMMCDDGGDWCAGARPE